MTRRCGTSCPRRSCRPRRASACAGTLGRATSGKCGTSRNYTDYCNEAVDRLIDQQSQELDRDKRQKLVWQIQKQLESDVARPMLGWRKEYFTQWPYVKNLVPHNALYNYGRMQEVWLDK